MASTLQEAKLTFQDLMTVAEKTRLEPYERAYEENRHRIYSLAFWMTDNEPAAETLQVNAFLRAFALSAEPSAEMLDRALVAELRESMPLGNLVLQCAPSTEVRSVRRNVKRVELERAVVQLPPTERLIFLLHDVERYHRERIQRLLGLSLDDCLAGLHQARLRLRELLDQSPR